MTMRSPSLFLLATCFCVGPLASLRAQSAPSSPPPLNPKAVLATLKDLRAKQVGIITKEKAGVLAAINAAIADPGKAYEQALLAVDQQGTGINPANHPPDARPGGRYGDPRNASPIVEMRKRLNEQLRDRDFVNGLRLQLVYLGLTWQHGMGVKTKDLIRPLLDFTTQVTNGAETLLPLEMAKKPLGDSVFVSYFQVGPYITGLPDWSDRPFDPESIFQKTILPEMRRNKDPRLLDYWDTHLQAESVRAQASQNNLLVTKFEHIRRPTLLWGRAGDVRAIGNENQGVADMLAVLKANPDHPDFEKWATELEGIVGAKADAAASPEEAPPGAPPPAPAPR